jgi:hypothetical protein
MLPARAVSPDIAATYHVDNAVGGRSGLFDHRRRQVRLRTLLPQSFRSSKELHTSCPSAENVICGRRPVPTSMLNQAGYDLCIICLSVIQVGQALASSLYRHQWQAIRRTEKLARLSYDHTHQYATNINAIRASMDRCALH